MTYFWFYIYAHLLLPRDRVAADGKTAESSGSDQRNYPFRFNVQIQRDPNLNSHGLTLSSQTPILVQEVTPGMTRLLKLVQTKYELVINSQTPPSAGYLFWGSGYKAQAALMLQMVLCVYVIALYTDI